MTDMPSIFRRVFPTLALPTKRLRGRPRGSLSGPRGRTSELMAGALAGHRAGRTLQDIAAEHGCTHEYVRQLLVKQGIRGRGSGYWAPKFSAHLADEIVRRWEQGLHFDSISRCTGAHYRTIRRVLRTRGINAPSARKHSEKPAMIVAMARRGCGRKEIAEAAGYTLASVTTFLHRVGIKGHPR